MDDWEQAVPALSNGQHRQLLAQIAALRQANKTIYPSQDCIFLALTLTPFEQVSVVILGQDPYHGPGQAHGLAFSVPDTVAPPPSLRNIFKEIRQDIYNGKEKSFNSDLSRWARQGVLLLNTSLTVEAGKAGSHSRFGWAAITDGIIHTLSQQREHLVFMLWGRHAQDKKPLIDTDKHLVLESVHPSPLSARRGFFGCRHFSQANDYLIQHGHKPIVW